MTQGEVQRALSLWTFGMATPWDGDQAAKSKHLAIIEARFDEWVSRIHREKLEFQLGRFLDGSGASSMLG